MRVVNIKHSDLWKFLLELSAKCEIELMTIETIAFKIIAEVQTCEYLCDQLPVESDIPFCAT